MKEQVAVESEAAPSDELSQARQISGEVIATINVNSTVTANRIEFITDSIAAVGRNRMLGVGMTANEMQSDLESFQGINALIVSLEFEVYSYEP